MIPLQQIQIKSPCHKSWAAMVGDDQKRYCEGCRKDVFNLSAMTARDAQDAIDAHAGNLCVRFELQDSGTVVTSDMPRWDTRRKARPALSFGWAVALIVAGVIGLPGLAHSAPQLKHSAPQLKHPATKLEKPLQLLGEPTLRPATATNAHGTLGTPKHPTPPHSPALMGKMAAPPTKVPAKPLSTTPKRATGSAVTPPSHEIMGDIVMPTPTTAFEPLRPAHPVHE